MGCAHENVKSPVRLTLRAAGRIAAKAGAWQAAGAMTLSVSRPSAPAITFASSYLDRAANQRRDKGWLSDRAIDRRSKFLPLDGLRALIAVRPTPHLDWRSRLEVDEAIVGGAECVFLGLDEDGIAHFAVDVTDRPAERADWGKLIDVRSVAPSVPPPETGILAQARSLIDWHLRHRFCAVCGQPTRPDDGGYVRRCTSESCKADHFPRTDPVVIMLALRGDMCLLGRQPRFMPGMYSALAGFVEPGESLEEAVRREVMEEAGIQTAAVRYVASQPWPFPSSLMIGCIAEATSETITIDPEELDEAQWFPKTEVAEMLKRSLSQDAPRMPPPLSLAHQLAQAWIDGRA